MLVLVFRTSEDYEPTKSAQSEAAVTFDGSGEDEDMLCMLWFKQTIGNAYGFYTLELLHAISNCRAREYISVLHIETLLLSLRVLMFPGDDTLLSRLLYLVHLITRSCIRKFVRTAESAHGGRDSGQLRSL